MFKFIRLPTVCTCAYIYILMYMHIRMYEYIRIHTTCVYSHMHACIYKFSSTWISVPDWPNQWFVFTSWYKTSENYFTYRWLKTYKILYGGSDAAGSDPPHKIMHYWVYYSSWLANSFPPDQNGRMEMFCTSQVPAPKEQMGGDGL